MSVWIKTCLRTATAFISFSILITGQQLGTLTVDNLLMTAPKAYTAYTESILSGARLGLDECRQQFTWETWNCPVTTPPILAYGRALPATRELAFARAVCMAGIVYTLTKNCSTGLLKNCYCAQESRPKDPELQLTWGGCRESFRFAEQVTRTLLDEQEAGRDATAFVSLHNNEAGRQAVRRTMLELCKCHGVSGSCTAKTCWKQLPAFRTVGHYLKRKYQRALLTDFQNGHPPRDVITYSADTLPMEISALAIRAGEIRPTSLVYLQPSPDYCTYNNTPATLGRQCTRSRDVTSQSRAERKSCTTLCRECGLRVRKTTVQVQTSCNCKFHWCCEVMCQVCTTIKHVLTCSVL